jgi:hypothetical protein
MTTYKLLLLGGILKDNTITIPENLENGDYREYLEWLANGNTPLPVDPDILGSAELRRRAAKGVAGSIPNWAAWSQQDWTNHFDANLSDGQADLVVSLAAARVMIKRQNAVINALAKMVIALRDQTWDDLPDP